MSPEEFSNNFDALIDSYKRFKDFDSQEMLDSIEFNEYEKSVFLTKAQEQITESLYTGQNHFGNSFEETELLRRYMASLVREASLVPISSISGNPIGMGSHSKFFTLPSSLWFITYESVELESGKCDSMKNLEVIPVTQDEYHRLKKNPFRGISDRRALRLDLADGIIEIVCKYEVSKYYIRYVERLNPIIVEDLPDGISIEGKSTVTPCMLHESLHQSILDLAVELALRSKGVGASQTSKAKEK